MNVCMLWDRENGNITTITAFFFVKISVYGYLILAEVL